MSSMNLFDPVEGGDRQAGRLQIPEILILDISDDGHYESDCITSQNPPHQVAELHHGTLATQDSCITMPPSLYSGGVTSLQWTGNIDSLIT